MGVHQRLLYASILALLIKVCHPLVKTSKPVTVICIRGSTFHKIIVWPGISNQGLNIKVHLEESGVSLECHGDKNLVKWMKDGKDMNNTEAKLNVGAALDDPRGLYQCGEDPNKSLQVYFRMCQNCIQLDMSTIVGIAVADVVSTLLLAVAVYFTAKQAPGRASRASDKQTLLANDQLYQPLGDRSNGEYSHIGAAKVRHR